MAERRRRGRVDDPRALVAGVAADLGQEVAASAAPGVHPAGVHAPGVHRPGVHRPGVHRASVHAPAVDRATVHPAAVDRATVVATAVVATAVVRTAVGRATVAAAAVVGRHRVVDSARIAATAAAVRIGHRVATAARDQEHSNQARQDSHARVVARIGPATKPEITGARGTSRRGRPVIRQARPLEDDPSPCPRFAPGGAAAWVVIPPVVVDTQPKSAAVQPEVSADPPPDAP